MKSELYTRGYEDALASRPEHDKLRFYYPYRLGYTVGSKTRERRAEMARRRLAA